MRIGVMTFWWSDDNYGQILQCYALQMYLRSQGHEAYLIRYQMPDVVGFNWHQKLLKYGFHPWRIFSGVCRILARRKGAKELQNHPRGLQEFLKTHLHVSDRVYKTLAELEMDPPTADAYIVGSDQVWRFGADFRKEDCRAMLLDFGSKNVARIAYAASFGREDFSRAEISDMGKLMHRFKAISVREKSGVKICERAGVVGSAWVCDPTLLLSAADYLKIAGGTNRVKRYLFCYMLNNECDFKYPLLKRWADKQGLKVVYVTGNMMKRNLFRDHPDQRAYLSLPDWLGYLSRAEYVLTNSFHCCVFALHFRRKLGVVRLLGSDAGMNARLDTLDMLAVRPIEQVRDNCFDVFQGIEANSFVPEAAMSGVHFLKEALG